MKSKILNIAAGVLIGVLLCVSLYKIPQAVGADWEKSLPFTPQQLASMHAKDENLGVDALARAADSALSDATGYQTEIVSTNYVNQKIRELDAGQPRLAEAQAMVNKLEAAINEISEQLFVLDKAYVKYKSQNYITFTYGSSSFIQRLSLKKTLMESVAVMLGGAWLLHERKRRKVRHHK